MLSVIAGKKLSQEEDFKLAEKIRFLEKQQAEFQADATAFHVESRLQILRSKHTLTPKLDIAKLVLESARKSDDKFFYDRFSKVELNNIFNNMDLSSVELKCHCTKESETQDKFVKFFSKLPEGPWTIHDSSSKNYLKDPTAKIDFAILDGTVS